MGRAAAAALLLVGATLTLARAWQPGSGPFADVQVRLAALVPLALPAYAVALVVSALVLRSGRSALVVLVPATVGLGLHLWWFAPFLTDETGTAPDGPRVRVLTVNAYVHGGATGEDLVALTRSADADVVAVQELSPTTYDEALRAGLAAAYPHRVEGNGRSGTMVWSRLPLRDATDLGDRVSGGAARVRVVTADGSLDLLAVHTAPPVWPRLWRADHAGLLSEVRRDRPDVLVGDLNATADHVQVRRLLGEGLTDAADLAGVGWAPTWPSNGEQTLLGLPVPRFAAIDHVLVGSRWTAVSWQRLPVRRSDHTAVLAEVARR